MKSATGIKVLAIASAVAFAPGRALSAPEPSPSSATAVGAANETADVSTLTGRQIVDRMIDLVNPVRMKGEVEQTIETTSGQDRTFVYENYTDNRGEKNLIRYKSPSRVKGQAILMRNHADDIWAYFPRTGRTRKLATHAKKQKLMGSDFTYEDLGSGESWLDDYEIERKKDADRGGTDCFSIYFREKEGVDASYPKMHMFARIDNFYPVEIRYFDEREVLLKTLYFHDIVDIEGFPTAMRMEMVNAGDGSKTLLKTLSVTYETTFPEGFFTARQLAQ